MTTSGLRQLITDAWHHWGQEWQRYARSLTRNRSEAEDVVSEALLRTLAADPPITTEREAYRYVLRAIRNTFFSQRARRNTRRKLLAELKAQVSATTPDPLRVVVAARSDERLRWAVRRALAELDDELFEALDLYYNSTPPLTFREVAGRLGISLGLAHKRVHKATAQLNIALMDETEQ